MSPERTEQQSLPEELMQDFLDPAIGSISERLGVTEDQARAICVFALVEQLNPNKSNVPTDIRVRNGADAGVVMLRRRSNNRITVEDSSLYSKVI